MRYVTLLAILLSFQAVAQDDVVHLNQGNPAPFDGYLFSPSKEKELRLLDSNVNYYKSLNNSLDIINKAQSDNLDKMSQRLTIRDQQLDLVTKRLSETNAGFFEKAGFFILGSVITGVIGYGVYKTR